MPPTGGFAIFAPQASFFFLKSLKHRGKEETEELKGLVLFKLLRDSDQKIRKGTPSGPGES
jgi:hypothetical protein